MVLSFINSKQIFCFLHIGIWFSGIGDNKMNNVISFINYFGILNTVFTIAVVIIGIFLWLKGILPVLLRLGNGLAKRKVAVFAKQDNCSSLMSLLIDSKLFSKKNLIEVRTKNDIGKAEQATVFLLQWHDWKDDIKDILIKKTDSTALIVYSPREQGLISEEAMNELNESRNVCVTNFRGRLLNDIVLSLITTKL